MSDRPAARHAGGTRSASRGTSRPAGPPGSTAWRSPSQATAPPSCAGPVADQSALHGLLRKLSDLGTAARLRHRPADDDPAPIPSAQPSTPTTGRSTT